MERVSVLRTASLTPRLTGGNPSVMLDAVMREATGKHMTVDARQIAAVLFDLDGTLVHSRVVIEQAWTAWCDEYDVELARALPATYGVSAAETIRILLPRETDAVMLRAVERHSELELQFESGVSVAPGAMSSLGSLTSSSSRGL
jgi:hypothetical protein